jgi:hypothetical protein
LRAGESGGRLMNNLNRIKVIGPYPEKLKPSNVNVGVKT